MLNSNIFINRQINEEIGDKIEKALINNTSNKYFYGKHFNVSRQENSFVHYQDEIGEIILPEPNRKVFTFVSPLICFIDFLYLYTSC